MGQRARGSRQRFAERLPSFRAEDSLARIYEDARNEFFSTIDKFIAIHPRRSELSGDDMLRLHDARNKIPNLFERVMNIAYQEGEPQFWLSRLSQIIGNTPLLALTRTLMKIRAPSMFSGRVRVWAQASDASSTTASIPNRLWRFLTKLLPWVMPRKRLPPLPGLCALHRCRYPLPGERESLFIPARVVVGIDVVKL